MTRKPAPKCPSCQSANVVPILYGEPAGKPGPEVHVGGCCVCLGVSPKWHCKDCQHEFGIFRKN
jgi:hypothetical protein